MVEEKKNEPGPRTAYFGCKNCGAVNEHPFPEVRVIIQKEPCRCGVTEGARHSRYVSIAAGCAVSILILAAFGSCVADHYFTTEQIKALPAAYKVDKANPQNGTFPDFKVRELNPEEKERRAMQERSQTLEKQLDEKQKQQK